MIHTALPRPSMPPSPPRAPSAIGRPLDPSYPTNRAVLLLVPAAAVLGAWWSEAGALAGALTAAGAAFGGWAVARELAPDDEGGAFLALALAVLTAFPVPGQRLLPLFAMLLLTRVVNRTVGPPAGPLDTGAAAGLAALAAWPAGAWPVAVAAACAFALDRRGPVPGPRRHTFVAIGFVVYAAVRMPSATIGPLPALPWLVGGAAILVTYGLAVVRTRAVRSRCDIGGTPLSLLRVRRAMVLPLVVLAPTLSGAALDPPSLAALWATVAAVAVVRLTRA